MFDRYRCCPCDKEPKMDPLSMIAIALTSGAATALKPTTEQAVKDAYAGLKDLIKRHLGESSEVARAVEGVEAKPDSKGRRETLHEELVAANVAENQEILHAAQRLFDLIERQPEGASVIQQISGNNNVQAVGGSSVTYNTPVPRRDPRKQNAHKGR
jgi:hypothetical protein